jgi:hypothetical protein
MTVTMDFEKISKKKSPKKKISEKSQLDSKLRELRKEVAKIHNCRPYTILKEEDMDQLIKE